MNQAIDHNGLQAEFAHGILDFRNALLGGMHGNHGDGGHTIGVAAVEFRMVNVEGPACDLPEFSFSNRWRCEGSARVEDCEVDPEIVQTFGK